MIVVFVDEDDDGVYKRTYGEEEEEAKPGTSKAAVESDDSDKSESEGKTTIQCRNTPASLDIFP